MNANEPEVLAVDQWVDAIVFMQISVIAVCLSLSLIGLIYRMLMAVRNPHHGIPLLLWRDLILIFGFSVPLVGIMVQRVMNVSWRGDPVWIVVSGGLPALALLVWTYFELVVIPNRHR